MLGTHASKFVFFLLIVTTLAFSGCSRGDVNASETEPSLADEQTTQVAENKATEEVIAEKSDVDQVIAEYERNANDVLLKRLILAETDIESASNDFERTTILREWVYANTNYASNVYQSFNVETHWYELVHPTVGKATAGAHIGAHLRNEMGDMCGHLSWLLNKVYVLWGYEAGAGGWSIPNVFGHTYTLVRIQHEGEWIWQIQDATFDFALTRNGQPVDIVDVLTDLKDGKPHNLYATTGNYSTARNVLIHETELENVPSLPDFYVDQTPKYSSGKLHLFESDEKWEEFKKGSVGTLIGNHMAENFGFHADPIYALLLATTAPGGDSWRDIRAIKEDVIEKAGYKPAE